jgi:hypothetical protein
MINTWMNMCTCVWVCICFVHTQKQSTCTCTHTCDTLIHTYMYANHTYNYTNVMHFTATAPQHSHRQAYSRSTPVTRPTIIPPKTTIRLSQAPWHTRDLYVLWETIFTWIAVGRFHSYRSKSRRLSAVWKLKLRSLHSLWRVPFEVFVMLKIPWDVYVCAVLCVYVLCMYLCMSARVCIHVCM